MNEVEIMTVIGMIVADLGLRRGSKRQQTGHEMKSKH